MQRPNNWYVLAGASCSGKTTLAKALEERGKKVVHELAREHIEKKMAQGFTIEEIRKDEGEFQNQVLQMKMDTEAALSPEETIFLDRGIPDSTAYYRFLKLPIDEEFKKKLNSCSYKKIFLLDQLPYKKDGVRVETEEEQNTIHKLLEEAYRELGFYIQKVPVLSVEDRVDFILKNL